jgi:hypothetical protein
MPTYGQRLRSLAKRVESKGKFNGGAHRPHFISGQPGDVGTQIGLGDGYEDYLD